MTPLLGFVDDVIVRVSNYEGKSRVDMRSKSREGLVDGGKNAKRIEMFLEQIQQGGGATNSRTLGQMVIGFAVDATKKNST